MDLFLTDQRKARIDTVVAHRLPGIVLVLEDIHDPHNAAAIFRTCDAFGIQDVYLVFSKEQSYNPNEVGKRTASSAHKWLTFHSFFSTSEAITSLKKEKYTIYVSSIGGNARSYSSIQYNEDNIALVMGNEHSGVSDNFLSNADTVIAIPMFGMVQSLNVSVASALIIAEVTAKRRKHLALSQLPGEKIVKLTDTFAKLASTVYTKTKESNK